MYYYLIGLLLLVIVRLFVNLKYADYRIDTTVFHEIGSVLFGLYLIWILRYLSTHVPTETNGYAVSVVLLIPCGFLLPLLFSRYRRFVIIVVNTLFTALCICLLQFIRLGKIGFVNILFYILGVMIGFFIYKINAGVFESLRRSFLIRKKKGKRISTFLILEADFLIVIISLMFVVSGTMYRVMAAMEDKPAALKELGEDETDKYGGIYYAEKSNYSRYDAYAKLHPDMSPEDVVWRVEANLDKEFYSDVQEYPATEKNPLLLNKYHRVSDDYEPDNLVTVYGEFLATPETKEAFQQMQADMKELGYELHIVSSYRSVSYQKGLYNTFVKRDGEEKAIMYSARGGFSEHCTGRALDVSNNPSDLDVFAASEEGKWAYANAYKYGFILRYPEGYEDVTGYVYESWHLSYVGKEISYKMHDENIATLEEYVVKYVEHKK